MQLAELETNVADIENVIASLESVEDLEGLLWRIEHPDLDFNPVSLTEFALSDQYLDCGGEAWETCK
jgi:hypothetical protein